MKIIFFDTETTGFKDPQIIQLAYQVYDVWLEDRVIKYVLEKEVKENFKPTKEIDVGAMMVHNITPEELEGCKAFEDSDAYESWSNLCLFEEAYYVAHNMDFDKRVMNLNKSWMPPDDRLICSVKVSQKSYPNLSKHKLGYLWYALKHYLQPDGSVQNVVWHDALGDVQALSKIFFGMLQESHDRKWMSIPEILEAMARFCNIPKESKILTTCSFGKFKGKTFDWIARTNMSYANYMYSVLDDRPDVKKAFGDAIAKYS